MLDDEGFSVRVKSWIPMMKNKTRRDNNRTPGEGFLKISTSEEFQTYPTSKKKVPFQNITQKYTHFTQNLLIKFRLGDRLIHELTNKSHRKKIRNCIHTNVVTKDECCLELPLFNHFCSLSTSCRALVDRVD